MSISVGACLLAVVTLHHALTYRPRTIQVYRQPQHDIDRMRHDEPDDGKRRLPLTWGDCQDEEEPCPYISCRHHLFLDVDPNTGNVRLNFPDLFHLDGTPWLERMPATCALRVAELDGATLDTMGKMLNVTRERARQLEVSTLETLRTRLAQLGLDAHTTTGPVGIFENPYTDGTAD